MPASAEDTKAWDRALSPSIVRAAKICKDNNLTKYKWKCKEFPELHPKYEGHLLAQTSRPGRERWLQPETVVGTKAWMEKTGKHQQGRKWLEQYQEFAGHLSDSWNLHPSLPVRDAWVLGSDQGNCHGEPSQLDPPLLGYQPKGYAKWVNVGERWTPQKKGVPRVVPAREFNRKAQAGLLAISQGKSPKSRKKLLDVTQKPESETLSNTNKMRNLSKSLPTLSMGPFPPSAAYVRSFMRQIDLEEPDA